MKIAVLLPLLAGVASAFAPSSNTQRNNVAPVAATVEEMESLLGVSEECGGKFFDPLNLCQYAPADWLRKTELANGRVAMLATVGWIWPGFIGTFDSSDVSGTDPIDSILQADPQWWAQWILLCGVIEGIKYRAESQGKSYTGDGPAAIDYAQRWDKYDDAMKEKMRIRELKNGRLAMIGIASFISNRFIEGSVPLMPHWVP